MTFGGSVRNAWTTRNRRPGVSSYGEASGGHVSDPGKTAAERPMNPARSCEAGVRSAGRGTTTNSVPGQPWARAAATSEADEAQAPSTVPERPASNARSSASQPGARRSTAGKSASDSAGRPIVGGRGDEFHAGDASGGHLILGRLRPSRRLAPKSAPATAGRRATSGTLSSGIGRSTAPPRRQTATTGRHRT